MCINSIVFKRQMEGVGMSEATAPERAKTGKAAKASKSQDKESRLTPGVTVSSEQCLEMVREAAYFRALARGFSGGNEEQDWLDAEAEVKNLLASGRM